MTSLWVRSLLSVGVFAGVGMGWPLGLMSTALAQSNVIPVQTKRYALVIGNSAYQESPLANPVNDARLMATTLRQLGFEVTQRENLPDTDAFFSALSAFEQQLQPGSVALVYYAGHGMQVQGQNYLLPTRVSVEREEQVRYKALNLEDILQTLERSKTRMNIVVLDACRNNPYERKFRSGAGRGLAIVSPPAGTMVAYATAANSVASDGSGSNGLYTEVLVQALKKPGLKLEDVFKETKREVIRRSGNQQRPGEYNESTEDFYFIPPLQATPRPTPAPVLATPTPRPSQRPVSLPTPVPQATSGSQPAQSQTLFNSLGMEFKRISAGSFMMGSPSGEAGRESDESQYRVTLTETYYMQTTEVTQAQWQAVMGTTVAQQRDKANKDWPLVGEGRDHPMYYVSWEEIQLFISKLNARGEGTYRLPTEAEWEYAARGGSSSAYSFGNDAKELSRYGNFADKSVVGWNDTVDGWADRTVDDGHRTTAPVASYRPNAWGLYDMHGNVWEWVHDWYGYYPSGSGTNPRGASTGSLRVGRGGSWFDSAQNARVANRSNDVPSDRYSSLGFRLVRVP